MIEQYFIHLLILLGIYFILALSLQIPVGFTGMFSMGHIAFYAIGAYTSALLTLSGFSFWFGFLSAGLLAMIFGYMLSFAIKGMKGDYFALTTISFSFVIYAILLNCRWLTNGPVGISGISRPHLFGFSLSNNLVFLFLVLIIAGACYLIMAIITRSPFGKVLESVRDNELASKTLGKNTVKIKSISLMISAFFAGLAGSLYAHYMSYIDPSSFTIAALIPVLCIVFIGGAASLKGTIIATFFVLLLPETLRFIGLPSSIMGPLRQIIYAIILILFLLYKPRGVYGKIMIE